MKGFKGFQKGHSFFTGGEKGWYKKGHTPWIKDKGMNREQKLARRKQIIQKYNSKKKTKIRIKKWHKEHSYRILEIKKKYAHSEKGREKRKETSHRRLTLERGLSKPVNLSYWRWLCKKLGYKCQGCYRIFPYRQLTIDHQLPVSRGGDNDEWNLQPLCKSCNSSKQNRLIGLENIHLDLAYGDWLLLPIRKRYADFVTNRDAQKGTKTSQSATEAVAG